MAGGKGAYVLTHLAIRTKRQSYETAKMYNNYFNMCITLVEMAEALPAETMFDGKPFRELLDERIRKEFPKALMVKDSLELNDKKEVRQFIFKYGSLIERCISDYVNDFHSRQPNAL